MTDTPTPEPTPDASAPEGGTNPQVAAELAALGTLVTLPAPVPVAITGTLHWFNGTTSAGTGPTPPVPVP